MALTPFPGTKPQRNDRTTFSERADAFVTWWLDTFFDELDAGITAFNFNSTNSTSATSDTIATGSTTITVQASKSYVVGMTLKIAYTTDATNWMLGEVTAYDSGTGSLTVYVRQINGSGTFAVWTISLAATPQDVGDLVTTCITGNGSGSTITTARLLTTTQVNTLGSTVSHSATDGTSIILPSDGIYEAYAVDYWITSAPTSRYWGIGKNITTGISTDGNANTIALARSSTEATDLRSVCRSFYGASGDVIRLMNNGNYMNGVDYVMLSVRKISNG